MLTESEISHLISEAKEIWAIAEKFSIAYRERYRSMATIAKNLRIATIAAGILAVCSTIQPFSSITSPYNDCSSFNWVCCCYITNPSP